MHVCHTASIISFELGESCKKLEHAHHSASLARYGLNPCKNQQTISVVHVSAAPGNRQHVATHAYHRAPHELSQHLPRFPSEAIRIASIQISKLRHEQVPHASLEFHFHEDGVVGGVMISEVDISSSSLFRWLFFFNTSGLPLFSE